MRRRFFAAARWASALLLSACSTGGFAVSAGEARCRRICEHGKACLPPEKARLIDCFTSCDDLEALNRLNECDDEVDRLYDCIEQHDTCAELETECAEVHEVYSDCVSEQCSTDPDRDICL